MNDELFWSWLDSPIGRLRPYVNRDRELVRLALPNETIPEAIAAQAKQDCAATSAVHRELEEYFSGSRRKFDLMLRPVGTPYQQAVWAALRAIPYGQTTSYGAIAQAMGDRNASRAVGLANGRNPIPIIVPCHRVVGANGKLTGYAGGLGVKAFLLKHENADTSSQRALELGL